MYSPQVTLSHPSSGRLPLLSTRLPVTFPAEEHHYPLVGTKLYCLVTEAHACEQLAQGCYLEADRPRFESTTFWVASECFTVTPHRPHMSYYIISHLPFVSWLVVMMIHYHHMHHGCAQTAIVGRLLIALSARIWCYQPASEYHEQTNLSALHLI